MKIEKHSKPLIRASWHSYDGGVYFVTICTENKKHYFGDIVSKDGGNEMIMSEIGKCAKECLQQINKHFPHVEVPLFVVMPNHIHVIIFINDSSVGPQNFVDTQWYNHEVSQDRFGRQSKNLSSVVRGLKIGVTKYARENGIPFAWQSRFYDRIVRNQNELNRIATYIENNIANWNVDEYNEQ